VASRTIMSIPTHRTYKAVQRERSVPGKVVEVMVAT